MNPRKSSLVHPAMSTTKTTKTAKATVHLSFNTLSPFERVHDQYRDHGIQFEQAIALSPTNPAFSHYAHPLVLMPTAGHTSLILRFSPSVLHISASVIGLRQISLVALDDQGKVIARHAVHGKRSLHQHRDLTLPLPCLTLDAIGPNMHQVALMSDAPFVVNDILFTPSLNE